MTERLPGGKENPDRGKAFHLAAVSFGRKYPIDSALYVAEYDEFLDAVNLLGGHPIPVDVPTDSDEWIAHTYRRRRAKAGMNRASMHSRMWGHGLPPFEICVSRSGRYEVKNVMESIDDNLEWLKEKSFIRTKDRFQKYRLQAQSNGDISPNAMTRLKFIEGITERFHERLAFNVQDFKREIAQLNELLPPTEVNKLISSTLNGLLRESTTRSDGGPKWTIEIIPPTDGDNDAI